MHCPKCSYCIKISEEDITGHPRYQIVQCQCEDIRVGLTFIISSLGDVWDTKFNSGIGCGQCTRWFLWGGISALNQYNNIYGHIINKSGATSFHYYLIDLHLMILLILDTSFLAISIYLFLLLLLFFLFFLVLSPLSTQIILFDLLTLYILNIYSFSWIFLTIGI